MIAPRERPAPHIYLVQPKFPTSYWGMEHFIVLTPYAAAPSSSRTSSGRDTSQRVSRRGRR